MRILRERITKQLLGISGSLDKSQSREHGGDPVTLNVSPVKRLPSFRTGGIVEYIFADPGQSVDD